LTEEAEKLAEVAMSPKRILLVPAAMLGLGLGLVCLAAPASAGTTLCYTVSRTTGVYSVADGGTQIGTALAGDTFENLNSEISHGYRYGTDETRGETGWVNAGYLSLGGAGCP
jgi:uncharacterized membrane protein HdeD (DUF308 family)